MSGDDLRRQVEVAILDDIERVGPEQVNRADLVRRFAGQGASERTLFRWCADFVESGRARQALARRFEARAATRAVRSPDPAGEVIAEAGEYLPRVVTPELAVAAGHMPIIRHLNAAIDITKKVIEYAQTADGSVRNAKLLLAAADRLRQCTETALRISVHMTGIVETEKFHSAIFDVLRDESPAFAERVLTRLRQLNAQWSE